MAARKKTPTKKRISGPQGKRHGPNVPQAGGKPTHDDRGKFLPGNGLGGNPLAGAQARFRAALQRAAELVDPAAKTTRFERICNTLLRKAEKGDNWALGEVMNRLCGKHGAPVEEEPTPVPTPTPGDVTINSQINNYSLPVETQERMAALIEVGLKALDRDSLVQG